MLEIFDKNRKRLAILDNAYNITETTRLNAIAAFGFSLPDADPKNEYCAQFNLIRFDGGDYYRIMQIGDVSDEIGETSYECEHVIALLIDTVMFGFVTVGGLGYYTHQAIEYVLNRQRQKDWTLDACDFARQFEYGWEQENLLAALFSIPNRFTEPYIWKYDTSQYPYRLSLKKLDTSAKPRHYIRRGHNRLKLTKQSDPRLVCTRLYALGAGEGVNQLNIADINSGLNYLQSPAEYIEKYGIIERTWTDRRYTDMQSLKDAAQVMLNELQEPFAEYETEFIGDCDVGDMVEIAELHRRSYITEITKSYGETTTQSIKVANSPKDIAATVADLADRQRIEMTYSQGATQIYADSIADNADANNPVELRFFLPDTMINVNAILCKIRVSSFRAYSKSSAGGGGSVATSSTQPQTAPVSSTQPQSTSTSSTQPQSTLTSTIEGGSKSISIPAIYTGTGRILPGYSPNYPLEHDHQLHSWNAEPININHSHTVTIASHSHTVTIAAHSHTVTIPSHSHTVTIAAHSHTVTIPSHIHEITPNIYFFGNPTSFRILINGIQRVNINGRDAEVNITQYLIKDGKIPRGTWHTISVLPNTLARAEISYNVQGFIQSRGDYSV